MTSQKVNFEITLTWQEMLDITRQRITTVELDKLRAAIMWQP